MPSFDIVCELDMHEVSNAVDQANREVGTRFDFKDANASYTLSEHEIKMVTESDFQLHQMIDILNNKMVKRGIELGHMQLGEPDIQHKKATQIITLKEGIETDIAKKIVKIIKNEKMKVQSSIQGDKVRVTGKKRDDLQSVIAMLREQKLDLPLQFNNFRD